MNQGREEISMNNRLWSIAHKLYQGGSSLGRFFEIIYNIACANGISAQAEIGKGTVFYHHGIGCVVHQNCRIGKNCKIFGNVTLGCKWTNNEESGEPPTIGDNVLIGAGAVVLQDIPPNSIAIGVPAQIKQRG